jgi:hypothetical protein
LLEGRWVSLSAPRICDLSTLEVRHQACQGFEERAGQTPGDRSIPGHCTVGHHQGRKARPSQAPRSIGGRKAIPEVSNTSTKSHITSAQPHWIAVGRTRRSWPRGSSPSWKQLDPAGPGIDQAPVRTRFNIRASEEANARMTLSRVSGYLRSQSGESDLIISTSEPGI